MSVEDKKIFRRKAIKFDTVIYHPHLPCEFYRSMLASDILHLQINLEHQNDKNVKNIAVLYRSDMVINQIAHYDLSNSEIFPECALVKYAFIDHQTFSFILLQSIRARMIYMYILQDDINILYIILFFYFVFEFSYFRYQSVFNG